MKVFLRPSMLLTIAVLALLPLVIPNAFLLDLAIRICFAAIIAIGLNFLIGFAGQVSIGHGAFVALGAYANAILTTHLNWSPLLALVAGATGVGIVAFIVAKPILRLKGHSLTMATLGLGIIVNIILINEVDLTGGPDGIAVGAFTIGNFAIESPQQWYAVAAIMLVLSIGLSLNLFSSPAGRALRGLHGSEVAAKVMGVDTAAFKVRVFVLSAVTASVAGSLLAHYSSFITPQLASFTHSIEIATMVVVGGMGSTFGAVFGAGLLLTLPQLLGGLQDYEKVLFGLILMLTMIFMPKGLVPSLTRRFAKRAD
jgi:branched-chain amino acid transport system permease protein